MNALANDQAGRLAALLTSNEELKGTHRGLYTGQQGEERTRVTPAGLITDRAILRDEPPDILLTELQDARPAPAAPRRSGPLAAERDEPAVPGARRVPHLRRRAGHRRRDAAAPPRDRAQEPLAPRRHRSRRGRTASDHSAASRRRDVATLGDRGDSAAMVAFRRDRVREPFDESTVVTESRLDLAEWVVDAPALVDALRLGTARAPKAADGSRASCRRGSWAPNFSLLNAAVEGAIEAADARRGRHRTGAGCRRPGRALRRADLDARPDGRRAGTADARQGAPARPPARHARRGGHAPR